MPTPVHAPWRVEDNWVRTYVVAERYVKMLATIESGDIPALVDLFKTYKPLVVQPEVSEIPVPTVKPESTSVTIPQEAEPEAVFTQAEVKKFFADKARGKFKGSQSDYKDMEEKIMDAAQAGRII